ncbi:RICIN domain-containing protein [Clostridium acetobutylicum]|uniref:RICIN domain-containing protein n=1 Tax=Clostridium acetobutylicum TaxID=1488 RepID=UPI000B5B4427|nr:RICIN domain-containing protein [Clostridium acetobutylicum]
MNIKLKRTLISLVAFSMTCLPFVGTGSSVKAASNDATINVAAKHQTIRGFGASSAWCGALSDTCMDTLYKNAGLDILRVRIAPNEGWNRGDYRAWADELSNAKKVRARGGIVFATPWTPPASMKTNNTTTGANKGSLKPSSYAAYAAYLKTFVKYMSDNGAPLYALSLQNEPDWAPDYDACTWTAQQFHDFLKQYGASLSSTIKIIMPESLGFNPAMSDPTLNDPTTAQYVSIIGGHLYGSPIRDYPLARNKGKDIWMTEHYLEGNDPGTCVKLAKEIHDCMTIGNMNAYVYWWISGDQNGLYNTRTNETYKKTYVMGQFSKFIGNGYSRVDATNSPQSNVYVSAYTGNNKVVIVAINQGTYPVNQSFNVQNSTVSNVSSWVSSGTLNMAKTNSNISAANGRFNASLPAQSVTTFVADLNSTKPTTNPTTNPTPGSTVTLNNGWYYIKNINAQKYLQVASNTGKAGQNVELGSGSGAAGQKWYLTNTGDGYVTLKSALGNYMLDVSYGENKDGSNIQIFNAYSGDAQKFSVKASSKDGQYFVSTKSSNGTKVLDDYNFGTADGTNVCQWTYGGNANQLWAFEPTNN